MKKFLWIIPMVIAFSVYSVAFNNFFVFDDFIWLNMSRTLCQNWRQMFYPDGIYFDPIVDLVSVMFSMGPLIQFLKYLRTDNGRFLWLSCFLFILALGAKGTPVVMPLFLLWFLFMEEKPFRRFGSAAPFVLLVILYFAL